MEEIVTNTGTDPSRMTPAERLEEVAAILAAGLMRIMARSRVTSKKREISRDNCLDVPPETRPPAVDL